MINRWIENSQHIAGHRRAYRNSHKVFTQVLRLIYESGWGGACHASSAMTHIALQELGTESKLVLGEAMIGREYFDHSWVEIDSLPIDSAIFLPLNNNISSAPVFLGIDVETGFSTEVVYRASTDSRDEVAELIAETDIGEYSHVFDYPKFRFLEAIVVILKRLGVRASEDDLYNKYCEERWTVKSN